MRPSVLLASAVVALVLGTPAAPLAQPKPSREALAEVSVQDLPMQAVDTLALVRRGGPFPYERDGVRFGNRERLLPAKPRDFYREYTVKTPGVATRGARRIVCGGAKAAPEMCYYTDDHYRSFRRIRE